MPKAYGNRLPNAIWPKSADNGHCIDFDISFCCSKGTWNDYLNRAKAWFFLGMQRLGQLVVWHFHQQITLPQRRRGNGHLIELWPGVCPRELKMVLFPVQLQIFVPFASRHSSAGDHAVGTVPFLQWFIVELPSTMSIKDIRQEGGGGRRDPPNSSPSNQYSVS